MMMDEKVKVVGASSASSLEKKVNSLLDEIRENSSTLIDIKLSTSSVENPKSSSPDTSYSSLIIYK
ncbi:sporulation protein Cse60 [Terribacillus sp. 179-K 1B1 HS]|uniref:sporulation protein Cse60 n=1 Tax=Terribacillus sp. 179-K 1B1 HS TaxID=3142388 RepID=UPI00399FBC27